MWIVEDAGRWTWTGDADVHIMVHAHGLLWEMHGAHVHRYIPADPIPEDLPLSGATWQDTQKLPEMPVDDDAGWQMLVDLVDAYEPGADPEPDPKS